MSNNEKLKSIIQDIGIDIFGVTHLHTLSKIPSGINTVSKQLFQQYKSAIVLGAQLNKIGKKVTGAEVSIFLEKAALEIMSFLEGCGYPSLIIHTEDEFDPINRIGLLSLKVLAKEAGLGWQGRSLLIVSPEYGPIHRLIAILTNIPLIANRQISNNCNDCSICIDKCPTSALTLNNFKDHPKYRQDVLDINLCIGDDGCKVCLLVCPYNRKSIE